MERMWSLTETEFPIGPNFFVLSQLLGHDGPSKGEWDFGYDRFALTEIP